MIDLSHGSAIRWQDLRQLSFPGRSLYGVLGHPVGHSLSPPMQEAAFRDCGLSACYLRIEVPEAELAEAVQELVRLGFRGWNCTLPLKRAMKGLAGWLDPWASLLDTVNTVCVHEGKLAGWNTDGPGWEQALREAFGVDLSALGIFVVGAGGTAQALARYAFWRGCSKLWITNRTWEKALQLARELQEWARELGRPSWIEPIRWEALERAQAKPPADLLLHATSVGLEGEGGLAFLSSLLEGKLLVYDVVYGRGKPTWLVEEAQKRGLQAADGLSLLLHQGALAFQIWTGCDPPLETMRQALLSAAGRKWN
ncbi:shikimate dehydrogenase family protein [Candidatus Methylacidithermus pantelleriae]|uniref:Shikimate dehydrogenase (NADP(+)) n=1 Tax=Candidatus Methylacidithermus pantelleriae TaxID=2744239 RepID=A0A8J2FRL6_9BACT|nr:shikimate dehydrogenase [Candidatus Methylacidithermus pantelleriae]CAF0689359.1 Shikimate dehydrogenase (NADP(+)) [Candidatus Methylacidithermus pantelleriae]